MSEEHAEYRIDNQEVRRETRLPFSDDSYQEPKPGEIRAVLKQANLTGSAAGVLLGVNGRTIRKWTGGEQAMPYSAWRLLLLTTGIALVGPVVKKVAP